MKKILLSAVFGILAAFSFTGCYDAIFDSIRNEVELEEGTITGFVHNIARYRFNDTEYLMTTNGSIYIKRADVSRHGAWAEVSGNGLPGTISYSYWDSEFSGVHFYKVAADANNVYALGCDFVYDDDETRNVPDKFYLYAADISGSATGLVWNLVTDVTAEINQYKDTLTSSNFGMDLSVHLFCTNTYDSANRHAYIRIGGGSPYIANTANTKWEVYELNGNGSATPRASDETDHAEITSKTLSAVYFGGSVHFLKFLNAITNEQTGHSAEYLYFGDEGDVLSSCKSSDWNDDIRDFCSGKVTTLADGNEDKLVRIGVGTGAPIISMCATKDSLLLGTGYNRSTGSSSGSGKGIFKVTLADDGTPGITTVSFSTNADSVMCAPYHVRLLFCTDPSKKESEADLYSAVDYIYTAQSAGASITNRGLWAYYPNRGNWNRE